jgi:hypothetical protein
VADELARHNEIPFVREGVHYTVAVPDDLVCELEIEVKESEVGNHDQAQVVSGA